TQNATIVSFIIDLEVTAVTNDFAGGPNVSPGDSWNYVATITNNGPNHALATYDGDDNLIVSSGSFFEFYLPEGINPTDLNDITLSLISGNPADAKEVTDFPRELVPVAGGGNKLRIMV